LYIFIQQGSEGGKGISTPLPGGRKKRHYIYQNNGEKKGKKQFFFSLMTYKEKREFTERPNVIDGRRVSSRNRPRYGGKQEKKRKKKTKVSEADNTTQIVPGHKKKLTSTKFREMASNIPR